uniref:[RNA-polymerase]-subunit kinase n=1 Tax=Oryza meridionalis TaxID=40149 RepID=A0A0E0DKE6_9ORYZ
MMSRQIDRQWKARMSNVPARRAEEEEEAAFLRPFFLMMKLAPMKRLEERASRRPLMLSAVDMPPAYHLPPPPRASISMPRLSALTRLGLQVGVAGLSNEFARFLLEVHERHPNCLAGTKNLCFDLNLFLRSRVRLAMAMDAYRFVFGEAKPPVAMQMRPILFHAHAHTDDVSQLRLLATDLHSLAWVRSLSLSDIDDLRDDVGIGGSCSDFLDYLKCCLSSGEVNLLFPHNGQECEELCFKILRKMSKNSEGTYSSVYKARDLENGKVVALKKVRFANMDPESVRFMAREIHVLRRLDHPHVVKLEGLVTSHISSSLYLVFEYMEHDLAGLAATPGIKFTEPQVKCYMQQLLSGLDHCHNHGVLHRDIKGANLLLDNNGTLKIADFGLATFFNPNQKQHLTSRVVTLWYHPPELLLGATNYGAAVDLWSAGCILAELSSGRPIMPGRTEVEQLHKIFKLCGSPSEEFWASLKLSRATVFKPQHLYHRCVNNVYKGFSSSALELLDQLLAVDPASRGTAASALESEPHACDPSSLPKYPPSKEYDAKLPDEEARRKRMIALKGQNNETRRRKQPQAGNGDLQQRRAQANRKGTRMDDGIRGFRIDPPARVGENGIAQRVPLLHAGRSSSTLGRSNETDEKTQRFYTSQMSNLSCAAEPRGSATQSSNHGDGAERPHLREHPSRQLTAVDSSGRSEWAHQFQERPSSSHRKEGGAANKEHTVVNGSKKNRIHYSGPLMPHGGNMEEILKEHER